MWTVSGLFVWRAQVQRGSYLSPEFWTLTVRLELTISFLQRYLTMVRSGIEDGPFLVHALKRQSDHSLPFDRLNPARAPIYLPESKWTLVLNVTLSHPFPSVSTAEITLSGV